MVGVGGGKCVPVLRDSPPSSLARQMSLETLQGVGQVELSLANWLFCGINYLGSWDSAPCAAERRPRRLLQVLGGVTGRLHDRLQVGGELTPSGALLEPRGEVPVWEGTLPGKRARLRLSDVWCSTLA